MQLSVLAFVLFATGTVASAAAITITKKTAIQVGEQRQLTSPETPGHLVVMHTRDGGYMACMHAGVTNWTVQRFSSSGASLWTRDLPIESPIEAIDRRNGELLFLSGTPWSGPWRLVRTSSDGAHLGEVTLPGDGHPRNCQEMVEIEDGLLLAGGADFGGQPPSDGYAFVYKLSSDLQVIWQRKYGTYGTPVFFLPIGDGGYLIEFMERNVGLPIRRIRPDGTTMWTAEYHGALAAGYDHVSTAVKCADGGFLLGFSSESATGVSKSAEHFGGSDFWLVKITADGNQQWDRSYGGTGGEQLTAMLQTDDGGFLVTGTTFGSGVTGNKSTDGNGIWLLKLNSRGIKEAEMLFPTTVFWSPALLPASCGFRHVGSGWIADIVPLTTVCLEARGLGRAFNLDVSSDLSHWTPLVINFCGDLSFEESLDVPMKFYRVTDVH